MLQIHIGTMSYIILMKAKENYFNEIGRHNHYCIHSQDFSMIYKELQEFHEIKLMDLPWRHSVLKIYQQVKLVANKQCQVGPLHEKRYTYTPIYVKENEQRSQMYLKIIISIKHVDAYICDGRRQSFSKKSLYLNFNHIWRTGNSRKIRFHPTLYFTWT